MEIAKLKCGEKILFYKYFLFVLVSSHGTSFSHFDIIMITATDLHIYILDAVPPIHVISNHVDTISLPLQMADRLRRVQPVAVANHVKARQSPIERA